MVGQGCQTHGLQDGPEWPTRWLVIFQLELLSYVDGDVSKTY